MMRPTAIGALLLLAGCVPQSHYVWDKYDTSLYNFYEDLATASAYTEQLALVVHDGDAAGRTAPGVHAEYGYMLLTAGNGGGAIVQFEAEKRLWPESTVLMDRMIGLANGKPPTDGANIQPAATNQPVATGKPTS